MKLASLLFAIISFSSYCYAEDGKCIALGRVGGEDKVCASYDNTDAKTCKAADGWAWCSWEPGKDTTIGKKGDLSVSCVDRDGVQSKYLAMTVSSTKQDDQGHMSIDIAYSGEDGKTHIADIKNSGILCSIIRLSDTEKLTASCGTAQTLETGLARFDYGGLVLIDGQTGVDVSDKECQFPSILR